MWKTLFKSIYSNRVFRPTYVFSRISSTFFRTKPLLLIPKNNNNNIRVGGLLVGLLGASSAVVFCAFDNSQKIEPGDAEFQIAKKYLKNNEWDSAMPHLLAAAEKGNSEAQFSLGVIYKEGTGKYKADPKKSFEFTEKSANQGNDRAVFSLGWFYVSGYGTKQDFKKGISLLQEAANMGNPKALYSMSEYYFTVLRNDKEGMKYAMRAAEGQDANAQFFLGTVYDMALYGVKQDNRKAYEYYKQAGAQGHAGAINNMADMIEHGQGVKQDLPFALELYELSASQGYVHAMANAGFMYEFGRGTAVDKSKAFKYFQQAADTGFDKAIYNLGRVYDEGTLVKRDSKKAREYYKKAADLGNQDAKKALEKLKN